MNPFSYSALSLRRRSVWEAADSGILLWRSSFIHFIPFFALPVWITACALRFLPLNLFFLSYLVLWWLKPLFDRLVLHVVSLRFFGSPAPSRFRELLRGFWGIRRGLLGDLLWRRFSPYRAAFMPIRILERVGRKQFRGRKKALAAGGLNFCSLISVLGLALEAMLLTGETLFVIMVTQVFSPTALGYMRDSLGTVEIFIFAAFCFNFILAESLYVCMGFGLYINSRVEIEGWDLQLLFQKFAGPEAAAGDTIDNSADNNTRTKVHASSGSSGVTRLGVTVVLFIFFFLALPRAAYCSPTEPAAEGEKSAASYFSEDFPAAGPQDLENLEKILASPDFGGYKEGWGIRFREISAAPPKMPDVDLVSWLEKIRRAFGFMLRGIAILAIAGFAGFALYWFQKGRRKGMFNFRNGGKSYANPLLSPLSPQSLFARAEDYFSQGDLREAWASCLAGCIGACTQYRSLSFPVDATEYGCLDLVRRALPAEVGGFADLVQRWILFAYGGRVPGEGAFEEALVYGRSLLIRSYPKDDYHNGAEGAPGKKDEA